MDFNGVRKGVFRMLCEENASELLKLVEKTGEFLRDGIQCERKQGPDMIY